MGRAKLRDETKQITVRLDPIVHERLADIASADKKKINVILTELIENYIKENYKRASKIITARLKKSSQHIDIKRI